MSYRYWAKTYPEATAAATASSSTAEASSAATATATSAAETASSASSTSPAHCFKLKSRKMPRDSSKWSKNSDCSNGANN